MLCAALVSAAISGLPSVLLLLVPLLRKLPVSFACNAREAPYDTESWTHAFDPQCRGDVAALLRLICSAVKINHDWPQNVKEWCQGRSSAWNNNDSAKVGVACGRNTGLSVRWGFTVLHVLTAHS
jgi:hypothetical protein